MLAATEVHYMEKILECFRKTLNLFLTKTDIKILHDMLVSKFQKM